MTQIYAEAQKLEPSEYIEVFEVDATEIGGDILRFHGYIQVGSIWWQGQEYKPWPIQAEGFELTGEGQQPTPTLRVSNLKQSLTPLVEVLDDLINAKVTKYKTMGRFLDAVNFPDGNPEADPTEQFAPEVYYINQKTSQTSEVVEFQLKSALDLDGVFLPSRQIVSNVCTWLAKGGYRGPYCGYTGSVYTNDKGEVIGDASKDTCNGQLSTCKKKFGEGNPLNYGGFPAASMVRM